MGTVCTIVARLKGFKDLKIIAYEKYFTIFTLQEDVVLAKQIEKYISHNLCIV